MLYFAYGSNLWRRQMTARCPEHHEVGAGRLDGWRWILTTRGYASIVVSATDFVLGMVYELSEKDVQSLDRYEGVSQGGYRKEMVMVESDGQEVSCLVYIDLVTEAGEPHTEYITRITGRIRFTLSAALYSLKMSARSQDCDLIFPGHGCRLDGI
jgi:gamma-glutamylcyclotransferase